MYKINTIPSLNIFKWKEKATMIVFPYATTTQKTFAYCCLGNHVIFIFIIQHFFINIIMMIMITALHASQLVLTLVCSFFRFSFFRVSLKSVQVSKTTWNEKRKRERYTNRFCFGKGANAVQPHHRQVSKILWVWHCCVLLK